MGVFPVKCGEKSFYTLKTGHQLPAFDI